MRRLLAFAAALPPWAYPWPVGPAPQYTPPARPAAVIAGAPVGAFRCGRPGPTFRIHLELFVDRKVVIVPAGIGTAESGCRYPVSTEGPDGIVRVGPGSTLADVFAVWGQRLDAHHLARFSSNTPLRAYVGGKLVRGPVRAVPLTRHAQIVVELGGYVPPHPYFLFAGGDS